MAASEPRWHSSSPRRSRTSARRPYGCVTRARDACACGRACGRLFACLPRKTCGGTSTLQWQAAPCRLPLLSSSTLRRAIRRVVRGVGACDDAASPAACGALPMGCKCCDHFFLRHLLGLFIAVQPYSFAGALVRVVGEPPCGALTDSSRLADRLRSRIAPRARTLVGAPRGPPTHGASMPRVPPSRDGAPPRTALAAAARRRFRAATA